MAAKIWIGGASGAATDFNTAGNWSPSGVPTTGDSIHFDHRSLYNLDGYDASAVTVTLLEVSSKFTKYIGSESSPLIIGATKVVIGGPYDDLSNTGQNAGSAQICLNLSSIQSTVRVLSTATSGNNNRPPVQIIGTNSSNVVEVVGGSVGIGTLTPGVATTVATTNVLGATAKVLFGSNCTLTTITQLAGTVRLNSAATTITQLGGTLTTEGTGTITTAKVHGTAYLNSTGTITNLYAAGSRGVANFDQSKISRTVTNSYVQGNGRIVDSRKVVTYTNATNYSDAAAESSVS